MSYAQAFEVKKQENGINPNAPVCIAMCADIHSEKESRGSKTAPLIQREQTKERKNVFHTKSFE